jgi:putative ABC transport system substrate-binding protein
MPDVILAVTTTNLKVVREATSTVPVVFEGVSDPVVQGFVASMAKPGGNLTGFTPFEFSIGGKWLDLLKEAAPGLARVAVMYNPDTSPQSKFFMPEIAKAARALSVEATSVEVQKTGDIEPAIASLAAWPAEARDKAEPYRVGQPTKFQFVINLKAAKALGIEFPPSFRLRATEVIE